MRVGVASAEKNDRDGNSGDRDLEEAAHLKKVVELSFARNSTDVLFKWPAKHFVCMDRIRYQVEWWGWGGSNSRPTV